jgi:PAS domain S-box-containing protein
MHAKSSRPPTASPQIHAAPLDLETTDRVLDAAQIGLWQLSGEGSRLLASKTALRILGLEAGEPVRSEEGLARIHPADRDRIESELAWIETHPGPFALEVRLLTSGGATRWLDVRGTSANDAAGFVNASGTLEDVTARKERDLSRELLLVTLSHDLRGPLTAIQIGAELLLRRGGLGESAVNTAQRILASAGRVSGMVEQILDFTRIHVGEGAARSRRQANLGAIARGAAHEVERENPGRPIDVSTEGDLDGLFDVERMGQLVGSLLTNAITHGDVSAPILMRLVGDGDSIALAVRSHGPPMQADDLNAVFEAIFDPDARIRRGPQSSLGLRLVLSREIVRAHGGTMRAISSREEGTLFSVVIPREGRPIG